MTCACGRPGSANGRECPSCFRSRLGSVGNHFTPTSSSKAGLGHGENRKFMANLEEYRKVRYEGSQPASTEQADVDAAKAISDAFGKPFRADETSITHGDVRR